MRRVIVIGPPGSGKSTFAKKLHDKTGLPLYYLDQLWFKPDKTHIDPDAFQQRLFGIMNQGSWIIEGNYPPTLEARIMASDTVVLMDIPPNICADGIRQRHGRVQESKPYIQSEETEELVRKTMDFRRNKMEWIYGLLRKYQRSRKVIMFHSRREADEYLAKF